MLCGESAQSAVVQMLSTTKTPDIVALVVENTFIQKRYVRMIAAR
ncbi:hypothetical protein BRDCF_p1811 [Bacteroidales bacterium CF]|nr:hypothetical protein BRDCF_p1811 [Bacteroidales bacterium CF]